MEPKILVAGPTYEGMKYCLEEFLTSIKNLDYDNFDILLVDNSNSDLFFNELKKDSRLIVIKDNFKHENNMKKIANSRNMILDYAKENNYDYILMMDVDVIPPKNTIKKLLSDEKDIVTGLYENYFSVNGKIELLPVAWISFTEEEFSELKKKYPLPDSIKTRFDIRRHMTREEINSKQLFEVRYPSAGCMLIKKEVFQKIRYGLLDVPDSAQTSDDIYFIQKAAEAGFKSFVDTSVKCEHLIRGKFKKDSEGNLIHPAYSK